MVLGRNWSYARNLSTQIEQGILSFDIRRIQVGIPLLLMKEVSPGNRGGRLVARRQPDLGRVRCHAAPLGRDPSRLQCVRFHFGK
jgi:hypothetical protein